MAEGHTNVVYIGSAPRSGSTILGLLLGETPGFFNAGEVRFLWRQLSESGQCGCGATLAECAVWAPILHASLNGTDARAIEGLARTSASHSLIRTMLTGLVRRLLGPRGAAAELRYAGNVLPVYRVLARSTGATAIIDTSKSPSYAYLLASAADVQVHAVHLIRDPRAVVYSVLRERGHTMRAPLRLRMILYQAAKWSAWNLWMETLVRRRAASYERFTYEEFVTAPERFLGRILATCSGGDVRPPDAEGPEPTARLTLNHTAFGNGYRFKIGRVPIRVDDEWRRSMRRHERVLVTAISWPLLLRYRYRIRTRETRESRVSRAADAGTDGGASPMSETNGHAPILAARTYWVVRGQLMAGAYPGDREAATSAAKIRALHGAGIRHIVNLMTPDERDHSGQLFRSYVEDCDRCGITVSQWPIPDVSAPEAAQMRAILDDIDSAIAGNRPVFVHCWGGRGRTGTVVGCWLIEQGLASPSTYLEVIRRLRSHCDDAAKPSPQVSAQFELVASWAPAALPRAMARRTGSEPAYP